MEGGDGRASAMDPERQRVPQMPALGGGMLPYAQPEWAEEEDLPALVQCMVKKLKEVEQRLAMLEGKGTASQASEAGLGKMRSECSSRRYEPGEEMMLCNIGSTLWDASALLGLEEMGGFCSSFFLFVGATFNLLAQMYLTYTVLFSGSFITPEKWEEMEVSMESWRLSEAHKYSSLDSAGVSLVSRVCAQDSALSFANSQAQLVQEINDYLGQESSDFRELSFGTGPMLSVVCIFMFSLVVLRELRHLVTSVQAVATLPRGRTRVVQGCLVAFSLPRFVYLIFMQSLRACVALGLLYAGTMWLAYTSEITELILNVAALGFVMDLDELLFQTVVPAEAQKFVESIEPLRYQGSRLHWEAVLPLLLVVSVASASAVGVLLPNVRSMIEVKRRLCGGRQDFVIQQNPAGYVVFLKTQSFSESSVGRGIAASAVDELRGLPFWSMTRPTVFSKGTDRREIFVPWAERTILEMGQVGLCHDLDSFQGGLVASESQHWFMAIRHLTEDRGIPMQDPGDGRPWLPFRCSDYEAKCSSVPLMRGLCPVTCGCADPASSQVYNTPRGGCPLSCAARLREAAARSECRDKDVGGTESWTRWWRNLAAGTAHFAPQAVASPGYQAWIERKIELGCNDTSLDPVGGATLCDEEESFMQFVGFSTIRGFCPQLCCVLFGKAHAFCPPSCPLP